MSRNNAYLDKRRAEKDAFMHQVEGLIKQFMADTLVIALNQEAGWGFDRLQRLMDRWEACRVEFRPALNPSDPEADVAQEHLDRALREIVRGRMDLIPWEERYPDLKRVRY